MNDSQLRQPTPKERQFLDSLAPAARIGMARTMLSKPPLDRLKDGYEERKTARQKREEERLEKRKDQIERQLLDAFTADPSIVGDRSFTEYLMQETEKRLAAEARAEGPSEKELEELARLSPVERINEARKRGYSL